MPYIGELDEALTKSRKIESAFPWAQKINKAVWRTQGFNPILDPELRPNLLRVSRAKTWSNVEALKDWRQEHGKQQYQAY